MMPNKVYYFLLLINLSFLLTFLSQAKAKTVVMVPGYFNSLVPGSYDSLWTQPYWSPDIIRVFKHAGYDVYIVNNLDPVGSIEKNGERLLHYLQDLKRKLPQNEPLHILAHSAGGLYTLYANEKQDLNIIAMATIGTPFDGVDFIEKISRQFPQIEDYERSLNIESLKQFRPQVVHAFLSNLKNNNRFRIFAYFGYQPKNSLQFWNAAYLSPLFYASDALMDECSDGIVTQRSSLARSQVLPVVFSSDYIHLDHWKQTMQAELFLALGMMNVDYIKMEQLRFYTELLKVFEFNVH